MAVRTANQRAYMVGEGEFRKSIGETLVIISRHSTSCELCQPFEGKVLIDDVYSGGTQEDGDYMLLSQAMEQGLYHPRYRHGLGTYYPELEEINGYETEDNKLNDYSKNVDKLATENTSKNNWHGTFARSVTKAEKQEIMDYAKEKGINIIDLSKFDGDSSLLKAEIDTLSKLKADFSIGRKKLTVSVGYLNDADFAETIGNTIVFNTKALRNREITEKNISFLNGEFASQKLEDIAAHEFGHILSAQKGNIGIDISRKAYYNVFGKELSIDEILEYFDSEISQYSTTYYKGLNSRTHNFDARRFREIIPEVFAKNNSNGNDFTKEFLILLKEV